MTTLTPRDIQKVLDQAEEKAGETPSLLRVNAKGKAQTTKMHIVVVDRAGRVVGQRSMPDAWVGSIAIARAKAFTAAAFSSDENALSTRSIGLLSQPGMPLWQIGNSNTPEGIIEFPGGLPLYRGGALVGAVGVSGDGVDQDEAVAAAGTRGLRPAKAIRIDTVTDGAVAYTG